MNFNDVSFKQVPEDNECIVNAVQISKRIGEEPSTIRSWANTYSQYLYIKKVNGRFVYTEESINQFKFIQKLRDKGFPHSQIIDMIERFGFNEEISTDKDDDIHNPLVFQAITETLSIENEKQLKEFLKSFMIMQEENNKKQIAVIKDEVYNTVSEIMSDKIEELTNENKQLQDKLDCIDNNLSEIRQENDKIHQLQQKLADKKEEYENNKGFFKRLFNK